MMGQQRADKWGYSRVGLTAERKAGTKVAQKADCWAAYWVHHWADSKGESWVEWWEKWLVAWMVCLKAARWGSQKAVLMVTRKVEPLADERVHLKADCSDDLMAALRDSLWAGELVNSSVDLRV